MISMFTWKASTKILSGLEGYIIIKLHGIPLQRPVSFDFWPQRRHGEKQLFLPWSELTHFLFDEREISEYAYMIKWIPRHITNAKLGNEDLLTEIKRIENPLFDELITSVLELWVVDWLQVSSHFSHSQMKDHPLTHGKLVRHDHSSGRNRQKTFYHDG